MRWTMSALHRKKLREGAEAFKKKKQEKYRNNPPDGEEYKNW